MPPNPGPDDRLSELVRRVNAEQQNGTNPNMLPPSVKPRPSGFVCPKCGSVAEQRIEPAPGTVLGYHWLRISDIPQLHTPNDERPAPVAVVADEITGIDAEGTPKFYLTLHCLVCFNKWQRRKMMEEIRANVPQLEWKPEDESA